MSESIQVRTPETHELTGVLDLRYRVLDEPLGMPRKDKPGSADLHPDVIHIAAFEDERIVSTVRLDPYPNTQRYLVRRMATDPEHQGRGIGASVLRLAENEATKHGARSIVLHSRLGAVGFYEKLGYELTGNIKIHDGDENPEMIKEI